MNEVNGGDEMEIKLELISEISKSDNDINILN